MREFIVENLTNTEALSVTVILMNNVIALIVAFFIMFTYKISYAGSAYSRKFNISIGSITIITAMIMSIISNNIALSLGMVGALSIVRFRTAVKEPMDLVFLFWSIAVGICCGAHVTEIAIVLSVLLTILVLILDRIPIGKAPMILVVNLQEGKQEPELVERIREFCRYYKIKSRNITGNGCNLVIEVRTSKEYDLVQRVQELEGLESVSLISHDGEVTF